MILTFTKNPEKIDVNLEEVEMDQGVIFLPSGKKGFKTFGVSSCIVFVAYHNNKLLCLHHWGTPDSQAPYHETKYQVENILSHLECRLEEKDIPLSEVTVYTLGGQESSQDSLKALRECAANDDDFTFSLDIRFLHICSGEDYFDLYVTTKKAKFIVQVHFVNSLFLHPTDPFTPLKLLTEVATEKLYKLRLIHHFETSISPPTTDLAISKVPTTSDERLASSNLGLTTPSTTDRTSATSSTNQYRKIH